MQGNDIGFFQNKEAIIPGTGLFSSNFLIICIFIEKNRLSLLKFYLMTFDNSRTIISLRIKFFVVTILTLTFIVLTYIAKMIKYPLLGLDETVWTIIFVTLWSVSAFLPMFLSYQYIYFSDDGENIILRYFSAGIVGGRKNSVEINKKTFSGYKTDKKLFGLICSVTLFQRVNNGIAKYPPIFISALKREQRDKVTRSLTSYSKK